MLLRLGQGLTGTDNRFQQRRYKNKSFISRRAAANITSSTKNTPAVSTPRYSTPAKWERASSSPRPWTALRGTTGQLPVHIGDIMIKGVCGTEADVVATKELY
ncbi:MAG: hypothetical protein ACLUEQ_08575 [Cloacibacillus evryensis]